jgi:hypothetical protein
MNLFLGVEGEGFDDDWRDSVGLAPEFKLAKNSGYPEGIFRQTPDGIRIDKLPNFSIQANGFHRHKSAIKEPPGAVSAEHKQGEPENHDGNPGPNRKLWPGKKDGTSEKAKEAQDGQRPSGEVPGSVTLHLSQGQPGNMLNAPSAVSDIVLQFSQLLFEKHPASRFARHGLSEHFLQCLPPLRRLFFHPFETLQDHFLQPNLPEKSHFFNEFGRNFDPFRRDFQERHRGNFPSIQGERLQKDASEMNPLRPITSGRGRRLRETGPFRRM